MEQYRYFLKLAYNGSTFHGWQVQKNAHSVQSELEKALSLILQYNITLTGAGRTDAGVHARIYYAHFDYKNLLLQSDLDQLVYRLNHFLPDSIAINDAFKVNPDIHARFTAISRTYRYYIARNFDPFLVGFSFRNTLPLDIDIMQKASGIIMQYRDFTCFAKTGTQTTTNICKVTECEWEVRGNLLVFKTTANRFLRNMVRAMVGSLLDVGKGKLSLDEFKELLQSGTRSDAGKSVPACGLFLEEIEYPDGIFK